MLLGRDEHDIKVGNGQPIRKLNWNHQVKVEIGVLMPEKTFVSFQICL